MWPQVCGLGGLDIALLVGDETLCPFQRSCGVQQVGVTEAVAVLPIAVVVFVRPREIDVEEVTVLPNGGRNKAYPEFSSRLLILWQSTPSFLLP